MRKNFTKGTTFFKWMFTDLAKVAVIIGAIILHIILFAKVDFMEMKTSTWILFAFLFDIGTLLVIITSIISWRKEKKKLN